MKEVEYRVLAKGWDGEVHTEVGFRFYEEAAQYYETVEPDVELVQEISLQCLVENGLSCFWEEEECKSFSYPPDQNEQEVA